MISNTIIVDCHCPICGSTHYVSVKDTELSEWQKGVIIYFAMPSLSPAEREQFIFGICPKCQKLEKIENNA